MIHSLEHDNCHYFDKHIEHLIYQYRVDHIFVNRVNKDAIDIYFANFLLDKIFSHPALQSHKYIIKHYNGLGVTHKSIDSIVEETLVSKSQLNDTVDHLMSIYNQSIDILNDKLYMNTLSFKRNIF